jgi:hypothetical protein
MRRLPGILILAFAVAIVGTAFGVIHHVRGARLEVSVVSRSPLSVEACRSQVRRFGGEAGASRCQDGPRRAWYHAEVRNVGHRGAWVSQCTATGHDHSGHIVAGTDRFEVPMWITSAGVGARPYLDPGRSASLDWFAPVGGSIDHYDAECSLVVYAVKPV